MPLRPEESKTKKYIYTIIIGLVFFGSIIGFTYSSLAFSFNSGASDTNTASYNGIDFFPTQFGIGADIDGQVMEFFYFPEDLKTTNVSLLTSTITQSRSVYITSHPNSTFASPISGIEFEMTRLLDSRYNTFLEVGFTDANAYDIPIINCEDATAFLPVVLFNFSNSTSGITEDNNCIVVNFASQTTFDRFRDKIIYELLEIEP